MFRFDKNEFMQKCKKDLALDFASPPLTGLVNLPVTERPQPRLCQSLCRTKAFRNVYYCNIKGEPCWYSFSENRTDTDFFKSEGTQLFWGQTRHNFFQNNKGTKLWLFRPGQTREHSLFKWMIQRPGAENALLIFCDLPFAITGDGAVGSWVFLFAGIVWGVCRNGCNRNNRIAHSWNPMGW